MMLISTGELEQKELVERKINEEVSPSKPTLLVFSGPSGVGKGTILEALKTGHSSYGDGYEATPWNRFATTVSATTRKPRTGELPGVHYHFISETAFEEAVKNDEFLEHKTSGSGARYGTLKSEISRILEMRKLPVLEIETEGKKELAQFSEAYNIITVFVLPPAEHESSLVQYPELMELLPPITRYPDVLQQRLITLYKRLITRGTENTEECARRLERSVIELNEANEYHFQIVNDRISKSVPKLQFIFDALLPVVSRS